MADTKLAIVRLAFPNLWVAKEFKAGDGKARYDAAFLIKKGSPNDLAIQAAIIQAAKETYGEKGEKLAASFKGNGNKYCYTDGDLKDYDGYEGHMVLSCHTKARPTVVDRDRSPLTADDNRVYGGCYVNAIVSIWAQKGENQGIRASFSGIQFVKDGESFGGAKRASADDFDVVEGDEFDML
jgi:hypothetical protein